MRHSAEHLPVIQNKLSPRQSPSKLNKNRNPFDVLITTGSIKPVCHKIRTGHSKPPAFRLPNISPSRVLHKVKSQNNYLTKANFFHPISKTPTRKSSDCFNSPLLANWIKQEITFGLN